MNDNVLFDFSDHLSPHVIRGRKLPTLWFLTDQNRVPDPIRVLKSLPQGTGVVFRDYGYANRAERATTLAEVARSLGQVFLVAEADELALKVGADGVHIPERHLSKAREIREKYPDWLITGAAHSETAVKLAAKSGVDAVFLSPIFPTLSHPGEPTLGFHVFKNILKAATVPVIGLGGIDEGTVRLLSGSDIAGIGAIGALVPK